MGTGQRGKVAVHINVGINQVFSFDDRPHPDLLPQEKGQRLHASLYAVVRRVNPVTGAWWFRGSRREFVGGNLSPFGG